MLNRIITPKESFEIVVQSVVTADYSFVFVTSKHAGSTHYWKYFQGAKFHSVLKGGNLSQCGRWCEWKKGNVITIFFLAKLVSSRRWFWVLFLFFPDSSRTVVWNPIHKMEILWSTIRTTVRRATRMVMVYCNIHYFLIDNDHKNWSEPFLSVVKIMSPANQPYICRKSYPPNCTCLAPVTKFGKTKTVRTL